MEQFNRQYNGNFILTFEPLKNHSDDEKSIEEFCDAIKHIKPDEVYVAPPFTGKLKAAFGLNEETLNEITNKIDKSFSNINK